MKTAVLSADSDEHLRSAADVLRLGGLVAFPTDTVYGLGAAAFDAVAAQRLYAAKERPAEKAIPILLASIDQLQLVASSVNARALQLASRFWPGPLTIVVPKHPAVPDAVASETVGIRIPNHPVALALLSRSGPLAVTSANLSGRESPVTAMQVHEQLRDRIEMILNGGTAPGGRASTVVDCTQPELVILRDGPLSMQDLLTALDQLPDAGRPA